MTNAFALGVYIGWPGSTTYDASLAAFGAIVGESPAYENTYVDYTQPMSSWVNNALSAAIHLRQTTAGAAIVPIVGVPMASSVNDGLSTLQNFQAIASGADDAVWTGIVNAYKSQGYTTIGLRLGWEMNGNWMPWSVTNAAEAAAYVAAFQHISTLVHAIAGIKVQVIWNPAVTGTTAVPTQDTYPGSKYVDVIGADIYSTLYPTTLHDWSTGKTDATAAQWDANPVNQEHYWDYPDANQYNPTGTGQGWGLVDAMNFAAAQGKPFALPEAGAGGVGGATGPVDNPVFPAYLASRLLAAGAPQTEFVNIWDSGAYLFTDGSKPQEALAWASFAGALAARASDPGPSATPGAMVVAHGQSVSLTAALAALVTPGAPGDVETITAVTTQSGSAKLGANGAVTYTAPSAGMDVLGFTVADQDGQVASSSVSITVDPGPQSSAGFGSIAAGAGLALGPALAALVSPGLAGDVDTITAVAAARGVATLGPNGAISYVAPQTVGPDTLAYTVADQYGATATFDYALSVVAPVTVPVVGQGVIDGTVHHFGVADPIWGTGQSDVAVSLLNAAGAVIATTVSDGDGWFDFTGLAAGSYMLDYAPPAGVALAPGSAANIATGLTAPFAVAAAGALWTPTEAVVSSSTAFTLDGPGAVALRGDGDYVVTGDSVGGRLALGDGNSTVVLSGSNDTIVAGNGNQSVMLAGQDNSVTVGYGNSSISGGAGGAVIQAAGGQVVISAAGSGNLLDGGAGLSFITAAGASNTFVVASPGTATITGFGLSNGDVLDFGGALARLGVQPDLSNLGSFVTATAAGGNTVLSVDQSGTGGAATVAVLDGVTASVAQLVAAHALSLGG